MSFWYWIAVIISVISFGGMSKHGRVYAIYDRLWVPLSVIADISAIILSGSVKIGIITAIVLLFGNGLLWGIIWADWKGMKRIRDVIKKNNQKEKSE